MEGSRKILVTGGAGFIPSGLAERLGENTENFVVIVDNLLTGSLAKIPHSRHNNIKFIKGDVNDFNELSGIFRSYSFDYVFHYAAVVGVKRTLEKRIYYSSSSEVYGEPVEYPQNEDTTPLNSRLPYAIVKNVGEAFLRSYKKEFGMDYTIFRFFNTFGPKQSKEFVVSRFISKAIKGEDIPIYGDGTQTRTFCFVDDNIEATINAFYGNKFVNDVVNIGGEIEVSILELARIIIKLTGSHSKIVHLPALEEGDMTRRKPDTRKMKILLKRPVLSIEEGLKRVIADTQYIL
jgi:UDP-glucuronate decarboxylase